MLSLPVRGAWIEISRENIANLLTSSLPVRGAWIEMRAEAQAEFPGTSLPVRGAWIEMALERAEPATACSRSPCGERGLKCLRWFEHRTHRRASLPVRGAWIEIEGSIAYSPPFEQSLPVRGAWIEMEYRLCRNFQRGKSLPVRGAWIEILPDGLEALRAPLVAPRAGSVD